MMVWPRIIGPKANASIQPTVSARYPVKASPRSSTKRNRNRVLHAYTMNAYDARLIR